ncbi:MAG: quinone-dependent dihydroorotate dehydrogenase [Parcubacteria group bacterium]
MKFFAFVYSAFLRRILFLFDPERVHDWTLGFGYWLGKYRWTRFLCGWLFDFEDSTLRQNIKGIEFKNPVGLAAGFDKNGDLFGILPSVGFGFAQVGTVTHKSYEGNTKPRLYRLPKSKSLMVNFGLKNDGVIKIVERVKKSRSESKIDEFPVSVSIGKTNSKETCTTESGTADYVACMREVMQSNVADFYTINISCPNTFGGEPFTTSEKLEYLLKGIYELHPDKPVFLKMPINLEWENFKKLLDIAVGFDVDGVIIGNLNKDRNDSMVFDNIPESIKGAMSGIPTKKLSDELISKTYKDYGKKLVIVGVGGIFSAEDAYEKIKRGASLVQLITGMIYRGPQLIGEINRELVKLARKDGYSNIGDAVGMYYS